MRRAAVAAQTRVEVVLTLRRGESVLLALGIPLLLLGFFSMVDVLPLPDDVDDPVEFLFPGVLGLAVLSAALVGPAIATGFEREYGVLKRLGATPLGRPALVTAKVAAILFVEALQVLVLTTVAVALGWRPDGAEVGMAVAAVVLATVAFAGLGLLVGGLLPGLTTLALANGLYVVLLLLGGMIFPLDRLPAGLEAVARLLPAAPLAEILHAALGASDGPGAHPWLVLVAWTVVGPAAAARWFRWH